MNGFDLRGEGDAARAVISYVPDQPFLYEKLTGREFLQFTADLYAMPKSKAEEKIDEKSALKKVAKERGVSKSEAYREMQRDK